MATVNRVYVIRNKKTGQEFVRKTLLSAIECMWPDVIDRAFVTVQRRLNDKGRYEVKTWVITKHKTS